MSEAMPTEKTESAASPITEETDENFRPTGIEAEERQDSVNLKPYDPEQIRVDPKTFSLRQVLDMIDDGDLELAPDFQRLKVWTPVQKSRLIESVLLRIPLPAFYFSSDKKGGLQVVDGLQRLSTIHDFVRGGKNKDAFFELTDLEYLQDQLGGKQFSSLDQPLWTRRINNTQIIANVIDSQTPYRVKFDIFKRINTGGSPLNAQEIRHCLSQEQSRDFLKELAHSDEFNTATGGNLYNNVRMVDREVILRFCAFREYPGLKSYDESPSMDEFLNKSTQLLDETSLVELSRLKFSFLNSMRNAYLIFKEHAFRKWHTYDSKLLPFNRALFDVWSVLLVPYSDEQIKPAATSIVEKSRRLMTHVDEFNASISAGTSDVRKVNFRFKAITELLQDAGL
jgi:hypothetical protein